MPLREVTDDQSTTISILESLGANGQSIIGWINEIGALHQVVAERDAEIARLTAELAARPPLPPPDTPPPPAPTDPPVPAPEPPPQPTPDPNVVQDLALSATFHALSVTLPGTFPPASEVDSLVYRKGGDPDWTKGLPLWSHGDQLTGSIFPLESDTAYDVRVTVDGVTHGGSGRTRQDARPSHAELVGAA